MAVIGYARFRSSGLSLAVQLAKLNQCDKMYQEKRRGSTDKRLRFATYLAYGATAIHVWCPAGIAARVRRCTLPYCGGSHKQVHAIARLRFSMLGAIASFEADIRVEGQMDGIECAKAREVRFGRHALLGSASPKQRCIAIFVPVLLRSQTWLRYLPDAAV